jgi:hypothetical protein
MFNDEACCGTDQTPNQHQAYQHQESDAELYKA